MTVDWQLVTMWATVIIAVLAVVVSIQQGYHARQHNKLSVSPYMSFHANLASPQELVVQNSGTGPAIITSFEIWVDDLCFEGPPHESGVKLLEALGLTSSDMAFGWLSPDDVLGAGKSQQIVFRDLNIPQSTSQSRFVNAVQRVSVRIEYESIYGDRKDAKFGPRFGREPHVKAV